MANFTRSVLGGAFLASLALAGCGDSKPDDVAAGNLAEACTSMNEMTTTFTDGLGELLVADQSADEAAAAFGATMSDFMDTFGDVVYYLADDKYVNNPDEMRAMATELEVFADELGSSNATDAESVEVLFEEMDEKMSANVPDFKEKSNLPPECDELDL